jgi:hypothetical protein
MEPTLATSTSETRRANFEVRPSAGRQWNPDAPDEVILTDGKKRGFGDLLQAINPLQHIPVVSTIYREITGTTIEPAARVIGGYVFGGPIGLASSLVNAVIESSSGKDIGGHVAAFVKPGADPNAPPPPPGSRPTGPDEGGILLASMGSTPSWTGAGSTESDGLLTTWIAAGAPKPAPILEAHAASPEPARSMPSHLPLFVSPARTASAPAQEPAPVAAPATAPTQAAAPAPAPAPAPAAAPEFLPTGVRGRSLAEYRAAAHAIPLGAMRTPVPSDPLAFQRGAPRTLASYRDEAPAAPPPTLPAAIEAQRQADPTQANSAEQGWVASMMEAGLNRYRDAQRRRDAERPAQGRL